MIGVHVGMINALSFYGLKDGRKQITLPKS